MMYHKILVPVDGSEASNRGLQEAIKLAKATNARLQIVHVVSELLLEAGFFGHEPFESLSDSLRVSGARILEDAKSATREAGVEFGAELVHTISGHVSLLILDVARQVNADLIVMGTHGRRGVKRLLMGSDAEMVLRSSPVPILFVRAKPEGG
jgi:nucleotide-binding universal stress UspA family protein